MKRIEIGTSIKGRLWFAAAIVVAGVIASGSVLLAQGSADRTARAIDQAQRAVRERIVSQDSARNLTVQFGPDARTEFPSNADVRVSGTGSAVRAADRMSRPFSYEAVVNTGAATGTTVAVATATATAMAMAMAMAILAVAVAVAVVPCRIA
jgi:hypothetical protein